MPKPSKRDVMERQEEQWRRVSVPSGRSRMRLPSEFRDSVNRILDGEEIDRDVKSLADWPKEKGMAFAFLEQLLPKLVQQLTDGSVRFHKTDYIHFCVLANHISALDHAINKKEVRHLVTLLFFSIMRSALPTEDILSFAIFLSKFGIPTALYLEVASYSHYDSASCFHKFDRGKFEEVTRAVSKTPGVAYHGYVEHVAAFMTAVALTGNREASCELAVRFGLAGVGLRLMAMWADSALWHREFSSWKLYQKIHRLVYNACRATDHRVKMQMSGHDIGDFHKLECDFGCGDIPYPEMKSHMKTLHSAEAFGECEHCSIPFKKTGGSERTQFFYLKHATKCPLIFAPYSKFVKFEQGLKGVPQRTTDGVWTRLHTGFPDKREYKMFPEVEIDYLLFGIPGTAVKFTVELATHGHTEQEYAEAVDRINAVRKARITAIDLNEQKMLIQQAEWQQEWIEEMEADPRNLKNMREASLMDPEQLKTMNWFSRSYYERLAVQYRTYLRLKNSY